jgi:hypothetical protein
MLKASDGTFIRPAGAKLNKDDEQADRRDQIIVLGWYNDCNHDSMNERGQHKVLCE